ncbi:MAG: ASKHA domain-containing protein, partial [Anaerolineae bacterium]|nr:ASKHA domain-containing protein [Anaerolineae bacterium]
EVADGTRLSEAISQAGVALNLPCGGQGRCGRCQVIVREGSVRRRSELRLSRQQLSEGYVLACQSVVESDLVVEIPPQEIVAHAVASEKAAADVAMPEDARDWQVRPWVEVLPVSVTPPSLDDNTNDLDRLQRELGLAHGVERTQVSLPVVQGLGRALRDAGWHVDVVLERAGRAEDAGVARLLDLRPRGTGRLLGAAVDVGTTSNVVYLVDMASGRALDSASTFNGQISCGEDVISRIIYSRREGGLAHLQQLVVGTINGLLEELLRRNGATPRDVVRLCVAGNTTMIHLFLGIDPQFIRLEPYIPTVNHPPPVRAAELGLLASPEAQVDCLPGVGAYVGADITAGVLSSEMYRTEKLTLFIDVGTNGEIVLGNADWLISCACSAGPAFEGAGVQSGMRAIPGAIDEVWINPQSFEPTFRTIGDLPPRGLCGSGLISLLAEMLVTGVVDKGGRLNRGLSTPRIRQGEHGPEYLVAAADAGAGVPADVAISEVDIANLIRAKGAVYAGFSVLTRSVGISLADVEEVLIGGSFGRYINVEKAVLIGLLPDMPWERFRYLGNTSVRGAYQALLSPELRRQATEIARRMTYLELSADNSFMEEFTSALFLPHTDETAFPSVARVLRERVPGPGERRASVAG